MRDVTDQIAEYFDVTVERVTADDVFAAARVGRTRPLAPVPETRLRPAWALAVTFVTTLVVVSGSIGVGLLLRSEGSPIGAGGRAAADGIATGIPWASIAVALVGIAAVACAIAFTRRRRATRERTTRLPDTRESAEGGTMTTTTPPAPVDERVHHLEARNRTLTIVVVVLAILAIGLGAWAVYQAVATDDVGPDEVLSLTDAWFAANEAQDGSVVDLYVPRFGYHQLGTEQFRGEEIPAHLSGNATYEPEWIGDPVVLYENDEAGRYIVSRPMRITGGGGAYESVMLFEAIRDADGDLLLAQTEWLYEHEGWATPSS